MQVEARVELPDRVALASATLTVYATAPTVRIGSDDFLAFFAPGVSADIPITITDKSTNDQPLAAVDYRVSTKIDGVEQITTLHSGSGSLHIPYVEGQSQVQLSAQLKDLPMLPPQTYTVAWGTPADSVKVLGDLTTCGHGRLINVETRAQGVPLANPVVISYEALLETSAGLQLQSNDVPWPPLQKQQVTTQYGLYTIPLKSVDNTANGLLRFDVHGGTNIRTSAVTIICSVGLLWHTSSPLKIGNSQATLHLKTATGRFLLVYALAPFRAGSETPILVDFWIPDAFTAATDNQLMITGSATPQVPILLNNQSLGTLDLATAVKNIWIEDSAPGGDRVSHAFAVKGIATDTVWRHVYALAVAPAGSVMLLPTPTPTPLPTVPGTQSVDGLPVLIVSPVPSIPPTFTVIPAATLGPKLVTTATPRVMTTPKPTAKG